jgi:hypothetical protein
MPPPEDLFTLPDNAIDKKPSGYWLELESADAMHKLSDYLASYEILDKKYEQLKAVRSSRK